LILSQIKGYLEQRGQASLADIALHFDSKPDAVRGMLEIWIRKGKVRKHQLNSACGSSCCTCDSDTTEIYEWIGNGERPPGEHPLPTPTFCKF